MAVKIRLKRMGRKKAPHYRVVVADSAFPRDGRFVESLGYYKPLSTPARLVLDVERVDFWIGKGATPSNTVKSLITRARDGGDETVAIGEVDAEERKKLAADKLATKRAAEEAKAAREAEEAAEAEAAAAAEAEAAAAAEAEKAAEDEGAGAEPDAANADAANADAAEATDSGDEPTDEADESAAEEASEDEAEDDDDEKKSE